MEKTKCIICGAYPNLIGAYVVRRKTSRLGDVEETPIEVKYCPNCGRLLVEEPNQEKE